MSRSESPFSKRLKALRNKYSYTQEEIGSYLNITRQGYSHYEKGDRMPDYKTLQKLSKLYHIPLDLLTSPDPVDLSKLDSPFTKFSTLSKREQNLLFYFSNLSPEEQDDLLIFLHIKNKRNGRRKKNIPSSSNTDPSKEVSQENPAQTYPSQDSSHPTKKS